MAQPIDMDALPVAVGLLQRLHDQTAGPVLFGHQDSTAYGVGWKNMRNRSDVKDVCGSWPAVYGWDLGKIETESANEDNVPFDHIRLCIRDADARGGINTISIHQQNPASEQSSFDNTPAVPQILAGGAELDRFLANVDRLCDFLFSLLRDPDDDVPLLEAWRRRRTCRWRGDGHQREHRLVCCLRAWGILEYWMQHCTRNSVQYLSSLMLKSALTSQKSQCSEQTDTLIIKCNFLLNLNYINT